MAELTLFQYSSRRGRLHGINPGTKMILLSAYSAFFLNAALPLTLSAVPIGFLLARMAGASAKRIFKGLAILSWTFLAFGTLGSLKFSLPFSLDVPILLNSLEFSVRILDVYLFGEAFFSSTSFDGIRDTLVLLSRRVFRGKGPDFGILISLTISFIPKIFAEYRALAEAREARGIDMRRSPVRSFSTLMVPLCIRILKKADDAENALRARGYERGRTVLIGRFSRKDLFAFLIGISPIASITVLAALRVFRV